LTYSTSLSSLLMLNMCKSSDVLYTNREREYNNEDSDVEYERRKKESEDGERVQQRRQWCFMFFADVKLYEKYVFVIDVEYVQKHIFLPSLIFNCLRYWCWIFLRYWCWICAKAHISSFSHIQLSSLLMLNMCKSTYFFLLSYSTVFCIYSFSHITFPEHPLI